MKKSKIAKEFLIEITKVPIVQIACEKVNVSRNTIYRWRKEDPEFAMQMDEAKKEGVEYIGDIAESQLLTLIKERNFSAVSFWLRHHRDPYKTHKVSFDEIPELSVEAAQNALENVINYTKEDIAYEKNKEIS